MKKIVLPLLFIAILSGCDENPVKVVQTTDITSEVRSSISQGRWNVSSFTYDGTDVTKTYAGYLFEFESSGVVTGEDGRYTHFGNWQASRNPEDTNTIDKVDFVMSFNSPMEFEKLNQTWKFSSFSESKLIFISADDTLEFSRAN